MQGEPAKKFCPTAQQNTGKGAAKPGAHLSVKRGHHKAINHTSEVISQPFHLTMETERKLQIDIAEVKSVFASVTYSEIVVYGKPD